MDNKHFDKHKPGDLNCIYWLENLLRVHLASATSLRRHYRWLRACRSNSVIESNYLGFAASLRALLESAGDVYYSLKYIPEILATNKTKIEEALSRKLTHVFVVCKELEDALIHHSFATKQPHKSPPSPHKAEEIQSYLSVLHNSEKIKQFYKELCDLTHPGMSSLNWLVTVGSDEIDSCLRIVGDESDGKFIQALCKTNVEALSVVQQQSVNLCVFCLWMLNAFPLELLHTDLPLDELGITNHPFKSMLEELMAPPQSPN